MKSTVLVVDDEEKLRRVVELQLKTAGFEVEQAGSAEEALKLTDGDRAEIEAVAAKRRGPEGDVYELERDRAGRHGSVMKYNLSAEPA